MKNKKIILAAVALVVVIAIFAGVYVATRPTAQQGAKTVTVTVIHSDGTEKEFVCHTDEEYLGPVLRAEELIEEEEGPYGMFILKADGESAVYEVDGAYWALYVGEEYGMYGADETVISDGGVYKLVYTVG